MKKYWLVALFVVVLVMLFLVKDTRGRTVLGNNSSIFLKTVVTKNENNQWWLKQFADHLKSLKVSNGKVIFETDGFLARKAETIVLAPGEEFVDHDHHGYQKFIVKDIQNDGILLEYESYFDHRSFSKNLIMIDRGIIKLLWK